MDIMRLYYSAGTITVPVGDIPALYLTNFMEINLLNALKLN